MFAEVPRGPSQGVSLPLLSRSMLVVVVVVVVVVVFAAGESRRRLALEALQQRSKGAAAALEGAQERRRQQEVRRGGSIYTNEHLLESGIMRVMSLVEAEGGGAGRVWAVREAMRVARVMRKGLAVAAGGGAGRREFLCPAVHSQGPTGMDLHAH
jgi:hypothetical protein